MSKCIAKHPLRSILPALAAVLAIVSTPLSANAQQPELQTSIWCDKAEQVESVVRAHLADGVELAAAVERTNTAAQDPGACVAATAIVVETEATRRFVAGNQMLEIGEFMVVGVVKDGQLVQIKPVTWFAAKIVAKLTAT